MPKRILAVFRERHIARLVHVNLERAGYEVISVSGDEEAKLIAKDGDIDLIALDATMTELHKSLYGDLETCHIPIKTIEPVAKFDFRMIWQ